MSWGAVEEAESYQVYRAPAQDGEYQLIGSADSTTYYDRPSEGHPLFMGTIYWYRVQACNAAGCSDLSPPAAGYPPPAPGGHPGHGRRVPGSDRDQLDPGTGCHQLSGLSRYRDKRDLQHICGRGRFRFGRRC